MSIEPQLLLLAAGASTRMGGEDKLLREIDGIPLILRQARIALQVSSQVSIVLPQSDRARSAWLTDVTISIIRVTARSMSASLRAGAEAVPKGPLLILLADMPEITANDIRAVLAQGERAPDQIVRGATSEGQAGHPVLFPASMRHYLLGLEGDTGAQDLIRRKGAKLVVLPNQHAICDLDTPEAWAAWEAQRPKR